MKDWEDSLIKGLQVGAISQNEARAMHEIAYLSAVEAMRTSYEG
jgi:hypothetical protein